MNRLIQELLKRELDFTVAHVNGQYRLFMYLDNRFVEAKNDHEARCILDEVLIFDYKGGIEQ